MKWMCRIEGDAPALREALRALSEYYPLSESEGNGRVVFRQTPSADRAWRVSFAVSELVVSYSDLPAALRAAGTVLSLGEDAAGLEETTPFRRVGIMLDSSRNAVMKVAHFQEWLRKLALLGYTQAMLYTEETYQIDGEPYFGYRRGGYTPDELRAIDAYAQRLGIEMIPCIQTLGHLEQLLKWPAYRRVKDTSSVLLVDEEATYALIDKMIGHWAQVFTSREIHVGMDEAHDLGRGAFLDRFGYEDGFTLFNRHLAKVIEICAKYGYKTPMIWSDMYFALGSPSGDYYDPETRIPDAVKERIPAQAKLVYWDYDHEDEAFYQDWIGRHRDLGSEPVMASSVWTLGGAFWHMADYTERRAGACIRACKRAGVRDIFFCLWGDDGALCDIDSAMHGLVYAADLVHGADVDSTRWAARLEAVCGGAYEIGDAAGRLSILELQEGDDAIELKAYGLFWDDPLLGMYWTDTRNRKPTAWDEALAHFRAIAAKLRPWATNRVATGAGDPHHAWLLAKLLAEKVSLRRDLERAYTTRDHAALSEVAARTERIISLLQEFDASFRVNWLRRNKPFGLEVVQIRLAGQMRRYREMAQRIGELMSGSIECIEELEGLPETPVRIPIGYRRLASACDLG